MPKIVDHDERKREIVEAVYRVIEQHGMEAVSLRDVAKEADVSMGAIQHYFQTKDAMLLFALDNMRERVLLRLNSRLGKLKDPSHKEYFREVARVLLPLDRPSRQEAIVNIAFFERSLTNPSLQDLLREGYTRLLAASTTVLRQAQVAGEIEPAADIEHEAEILFFSIQGLIGPTLIGAIKPRAAMRIVDRQIELLFH